jgi:D-cysteine desulfhydrase family pyridoxal phosphate-dependent enzyme
MTRSQNSDFPAELGNMASVPRVELVTCRTALESLPRLTEYCGGAQLFVKRDDCTGLAFGGNKARQLEFYLGEARARNADTILITGAVQSNFVRAAAAGARKLGMDCHIQQEERVTTSDTYYHSSGNVFLNKLLGATLHPYPHGEDEAGADRQIEELSQDLKKAGKKPYIIHLAPGHPPLGALGYVVAAKEILNQIEERQLVVDEIFVASGSGATHGGLLFGLRALGSSILITGVCVRRQAELQAARIRDTCNRVASLLDIESPVAADDIKLIDAFLAPGYGLPGKATLDAIVLGARTDGLMLDPVYTGKAFAAIVDRAKSAPKEKSYLFVHTGGSPAIFAYQDTIGEALVQQ